MNTPRVSRFDGFDLLLSCFSGLLGLLAAFVFYYAPVAYRFLVS